MPFKGEGRRRPCPIPPTVWFLTAVAALTPTSCAAAGDGNSATPCSGGVFSKKKRPVSYPPYPPPDSIDGKASMSDDPVAVSFDIFSSAAAVAESDLLMGTCLSSTGTSAIAESSSSLQMGGGLGRVRGAELVARRFRELFRSEYDENFWAVLVNSADSI